MTKLKAWHILFFAGVLANIVAGQDPATTASGASEVSEALKRSLESSGKLRDSVGRIVNKSSEEVLSIKSLLTTNAKVTKAMNDLLLEMASMTTRMEEFGAKMEKCRVELKSMEEQEQSILSPEDVGHPALLQLSQHAESLKEQADLVRRGLVPDVPSLV